MRADMSDAIPAASATTDGDDAADKVRGPPTASGEPGPTAFALLVPLLWIAFTVTARSATIVGAGHDLIKAQTSTVVVLRGLDKMTGRSAEIIAPIGVPVYFATLRIMARYCYSTPPSDIPETVAFLQIDDDRPEQPPKRVFSGWMYASSPSLNALDHPLYDVWSVACRSTVPNETPGTVASLVTAGVNPPDSTDREGLVRIPKEAGQ